MLAGETWNIVGICFGLAAISSCCASLIADKPPAIRRVLAGAFYTGASAVGIAFLVMHLYGLQQTLVLYFTSILTGLQSVEALAVMWSKIFPAIVNWCISRFTGSNALHEPPPPKKDEP